MGAMTCILLIFILPILFHKQLKITLELAKLCGPYWVTSSGAQQHQSSQMWDYLIAFNQMGMAQYLIHYIGPYVEPFMEVWIDSYIARGEVSLQERVLQDKFPQQSTTAGYISYSKTSWLTTGVISSCSVKDNFSCGLLDIEWRIIAGVS